MLWVHMKQKRSRVGVTRVSGDRVAMQKRSLLIGADIQN
jgi:hypothetical protein